MAVALVTAACSGTDDGATDDATSGAVVAAGSSTVLPVAEIVLEEYAAAAPDVDASYTSIGSGGGFERLCETGDVDISGASRAIKDEEAQLCAENSIEFLELQFAIDALTMVTSNETDYLECFSTEDIVETFGPDRADTWDQVVDGAPADELQIFAPDTDSGTYGFMVKDVMGLEESTQDYSASADDNVIVQGIESAKGTWGFFGLAYYDSNEDGLKAIAHENEAGDCVLPSIETAEDGTYELVRPLFIYVRTDALNEKPQVADFVNFFLEDAPVGVDFVGYVNSPDKLQASKDAVAAAMS
jgi:phosphate transport system substrate-binding protein